MSSSAIVTGKVRATFVNVFEPRVNELSGQEEYSLQILIPKTDKETLSAIKGAVEEAANAKWPKKRPAKFRFPLRDGDAPEEAEGTEKYPERAGHFFVNVKSKFAPQIVDRQRAPVVDRSEFQSGDYCRVSLNAYPYDMKGNCGVSLGLQNIQVWCKGEPLGGAGARAEDQFSELPADNEETDDLLAI